MQQAVWFNELLRRRQIDTTQVHLDVTVAGYPGKISGAEDFQHDREQQNRTALAGYQVLGFTWLDLTELPERVLAEIRYAVATRAR